MLPQIKGPTRWAVILCRFNDVPESSRPLSHFNDFFTQSGAGRGGLFDYWRDISYRTIDLSGSTVRGWYTMQYSFRNDWRRGRGDWINEAIRLSQGDVDFSQYQGIVAVLNAPVDDSALGVQVRTINGHTKAWGLFALTTSDSLGQANWRHCRKCEGMFFAGNPTRGVCPLDQGEHDMTGSSDYVLANASTDFFAQSQANWRWCQKCQGLFFAGNPTHGVCPADNRPHDAAIGGEYRLARDMPSNFPYQPMWYWCGKCQALFFSASGRLSGRCPMDGRQHDGSSSSNYTLMFNESHVEVTFGGHEMGHAYGLGHSWRSNPDVEYGDSWDLMSAMNVAWFPSGGPYGPSGPSINAPTLYKLGWLPEDRVWTRGLAGSTIRLVALNRSDVAGPLMAKVVTADRIYTVEFRQRAAWDRGIQRDGVLIHELRTRYTVGQQHWRWCQKCQGLFYAGQSICSAGGVHDHTGSSSYRLEHSVPSVPNRSQADWKWCHKCQGLAYSRNSSPSACPAGGAHDLGQGSNYNLPFAAAAPREYQPNWEWCRKCQGLAYSGNPLGACPAGGVHDFAGSGHYALAHDTPDAPNTQGDWRWCRKCQSLAFAGWGSCPGGGVHDHLGSSDYSLALDAPGAPGQNNWKWCRKCYGLAFAGNRGVCQFDRGEHDFSYSGDYTLISDMVGGPGQNNWRWCSKCQGLAYAGGTSLGPCPAGGQHDRTRSSDYRLVSFGDDLSYLIQSTSSVDWQMGQVFEDRSRGVRISVDSINSASSTATITL